MQNWSNPPYDGTLIDACNDRTRAHRRGVVPYVSLIGMEVERVGPSARHAAGARRVLLPCHNSVGSPPQLGEEVECSGLGLGTHWRVVAVAQGYPGQFAVRR